MDWFYREFGARVREARGEAITQQELARRVGLSRASVANVERGAQRVPLHMIVAFSEALNLNPEDLLPAGRVENEPELSPALVGRLPEESRDALRLVLRKASQGSAGG